MNGLLIYQIYGNDFKMKRNRYKQCPFGYKLWTGVFREELECEGKSSYHFFYDCDGFCDPGYAYFLQTQLLANKLLHGLDGYIFYVQLFVETAHDFAVEEICSWAHWNDEKGIKFLSCEKIGSPPVLQKFTFFTKNLNAVSQNTKLIPEEDWHRMTGIFVDYYAIKADDFLKEVLGKRNSEQIKKDADFALISDDIHAVWTILRTKEYSQNLLIENLGKFCDAYSAKLNIYV